MSVKTKKVLVKKMVKKISPDKPIKKAKKVKKIPKSLNKKKKSTKKIIIKQKPKKQEAIHSDRLTDAFFKAKIKVIGIGGGGGSIVSEIGRSLDKAKFVIADTDSRNFKKRTGIKYFLFGQKLTHGLGSGLDPEIGKMAAEEEREKITQLFEGEDLLIFVASLGGGIGSGATQVFTEIAKNFEGISFGIFTLPFKFEGKNKHKLATKALNELRGNLDVSLTIENEKIFKIIDPDTSIANAFSLVNKNLIESLESLIDLIYNPGVINIDFADLRAILSGKGNIAFLNTAEASGKDKLEKISKEILHNPLYQNPIDAKHNSNVTDQKILFNIAGGKNLSMFEVDKISRHVTEQNPKAKIIFGISKLPKYKDKIKVTILITSSPVKKQRTVIEKLPSEKTLVVTKSLSTAKSPLAKKVMVKKNTNKKIKKKRNIKKEKSTKNDSHKNGDGGISLTGALETAFNKIPVMVEDSVMPSVLGEIKEPKKTIRRSALEIKSDEEMEEKKKSQQEKEWEIPAFLRLKKR